VQHFAATKSWFIGQTQRFTINDRGVVLPVANGIGLDLIGEQPHDLAGLIQWTYARRRGAFIDVGANVGRVLVQLIRFDRAISYVGFEPQPAPAYHCSEIIRLNDLSMTHALLPVGLSDRSGIATFYRNGEDDVSGTIDTSTRVAEGFRFRTQIAVGRGDDYLTDIPDIALLKIDVEGAEIPALRGLERTIRKHLPVIAFEVTPWSHLDTSRYHQLIAAREQHARSIRAEIEAYGYVIGTFDSSFRPGADLASSNCEAYDFLAVHPTTMGIDPGR
jgi:FkbM family methyltransferase